MGSFLTRVSKGQDGQHVQSRDKRIVSGKPVCTYCKGQHNSVHCNVVTDVKAHLEMVRGRNCVLVVRASTSLHTVILRYRPLLTSHTRGIFCVTHAKCTGVPRKIVVCATIMIAW